MRRIVILFLLVAFTGADGHLGTTSTATSNITLVIPPRPDKVDAVTGQVIEKGNISPQEFDTRVVKETETTKIIIYVPKVDR